MHPPRHWSRVIPTWSPKTAGRARNAGLGRDSHSSNRRLWPNGRRCASQECQMDATRGGEEDMRRNDAHLAEKSPVSF
jgi:hypothetical protein